MFTDKEDLLELAKAGYQITVINNAKTVYIGCQFGGGSRKKKKETTIDKTETVQVEVEVVEEVSDSSLLNRDESPATETVKMNPKAEEVYNKLLTMEDDLTVAIDESIKTLLSDELIDFILSSNDENEIDDKLEAVLNNN
jgi:hypothetical protein